MENPFNITKAVDYTDDEILQYWVDLSNNGFAEIIKPISPMPVLILGSKGSGKTHLMRYYSYPLQKKRHSDNILDDKYIGIYLRCSGLNSSRFEGKGIDLDVWRVVFGYYLDLWLSQITLGIICDLGISPDVEETLCSKILELFDVSDAKCENLIDLLKYFNELQKDVDYKVNNCATSRNLNNLDIKCSTGKLIYGIPKLLEQTYSKLKGVTFLYLVDELENFSEYQQEVINTLYREREFPTSFRLGARPYGIKTYKTLSGGEVNKEGSEFEKIILDDFFRHNLDVYKSFITDVCVNKLKNKGYKIGNDIGLNDYLEQFDISDFLTKINDKTDKTRNVGLLKVRKNLSAIKGIDIKDIDAIINNLTFKEDLIIQRTNILMFYRAWRNKEELINASAQIKKSAELYIKSPKESQHKTVLDYFRNDIIHFIARESQEKIPYTGFDTFITMSSGISRNLLNILKYTYRWSYFNDDIKPFTDPHQPISIVSQINGVLDTSEWYLEDNRMPGKDGIAAYNSLIKLGRYLQTLKYSNVPPECSICAFSMKDDLPDEEANRILDYLEKFTLIIRVSGRRDKNSSERLSTYTINPIISAKWDLSVYRRGIVRLNKEEVLAIFSNNKEEEYATILKSATDNYNAPFHVGPSSSLKTSTLF